MGVKGAAYRLGIGGDGFERRRSGAEGPRRQKVIARAKRVNSGANCPCLVIPPSSLERYSGDDQHGLRVKLAVKKSKVPCYALTPQQFEPNLAARRKLQHRPCPGRIRALQT